ncbi:MAG: PilZ domain-containing protein [Planctomycetota bacterium]|nr:PilZ domain-containing protein [Planctomycetota bacterium]
MTERPADEPPRLRGIDIIRMRHRGRRSDWFEGVQTMLARTVAVKRLRVDLAAAGFADSFIEAGRRAAEIVHPSSLPVYNVFPEQNCIVMEWCPDQSLGGKSRVLSTLDALRVGAGVFDCLAGLHATGRCHGNLFPGNVFLLPSGWIRVDDFFQPASGAGRPLFADDSRYVAPELLAGGCGDWRSDLFSLGAILREALAPEAAGDRLSAAIGAFLSAAPERRGASPAAALQFFKASLRREENRLGGSTPRPQRQYRRIPAEMSVQVKRRSATPVETAAILSKIRDIGENGVFVGVPDPLAVGSIVELDFELRGDYGNIHAFGVVRWRSEAQAASGMGVQFVEVDDDGVEKLRNYMRLMRTERKEK